MPASKQEALALQAIDAWLSYRVMSGLIPGLQLAIRKKGALLFSKAYGFAALETQEKLTSKHLGQESSQSKSVAAALTLRLQDQGVLRLDDLLVTHLPVFKTHPDKRAHAIRLRDLLTHRAGFQRDINGARHWELEQSFPSSPELLAALMARPLVYGPNEVTKYSNLDYSLLGLALEAATGQSYATLVEKEIARPLALKALQADIGLKRKERLATGHSRLFPDGSRLSFPYQRANAFAPATGLAATAEDLALFYENFLGRSPFLSRAARKEIEKTRFPIQNEPTRFYGLGLQYDPLGPYAFQGHSGVFAGFLSATHVSKEQGLTFSFSVNGDQTPKKTFWQDIMKGLLGFFADVQQSFPEKGLEARCSPILFSRNYTSLFLVNEKQALEYCLDAPCPPPGERRINRGGGYYADQASGYTSIGEPLTFHRGKEGKILSATQDGDMTYRPFQAFIERLKPYCPHRKEDPRKVSSSER